MMGEKILERVEVSKATLLMLVGVPWVTIIMGIFQTGQWKSSMEAKSFDTFQQKQDVLTKVSDPNTHWDYQKLDSRYVVKAELEIKLEQFSENQEKIMRKLNIE